MKTITIEIDDDIFDRARTALIEKHAALDPKQPAFNPLEQTVAELMFIAGTVHTERECALITKHFPDGVPADMRHPLISSVALDEYHKAINARNETK